MNSFPCKDSLKWEQHCQCSVLLFFLLSISHFVSLSCCLAWHLFYNTFNLVSAL